ncbi:hypothetical protein [Pontibacillus litoralis]|uniref:Uncharacterized protein n=1 Tax=Pontibacillus litoralis JSM 072002 TaxID=1385512 RepID=A0A0A5G9F8_9BACI|nr:hypothetical protein [Pontibacillus litoralis]KGX87813.1 hypothetical protein N784_14130 [Pontibacillus litoralis JSM 072002]
MEIINANHFFNIEYILTEEVNEPHIPHSYEVIHRSNANPAFIIAKTEANFPFAYVEDRMITREEFSKLNPLEKEIFLTQSVVLETNEDFGLKKFEEKSQVECL